MWKKFICLCLIVCTLLSNTTNIFASDAAARRQEGAAKWSYIQVLNSTLSISSSGKATISASISANPLKVDEVSIRATLQQNVNGSWRDVTSWDVSKSSDGALLGKTYYVASGYSYRVSCTFKAYVNGRVVETATLTSNTVKY